MIRSLARRARLLLVGGLMVMSLSAAVPAMAVEDCNDIESAWERTLCFVSTQVELMIELFFDN